MDPFGTTQHASGYWQAATARWRGAVTVQRSTDLAALTDSLGVPRKTTWTFDGGEAAPSMVAEIVIEQRTPELRSFTITAPPGERGLQSVDFRTVDVDALIRSVLAPYVVQVRESAGGWEQVDVDPAAAHDAVDHARKRRRRITPALLEQVAEVYRSAVPTGRPLLAVQAALGLESANTAKFYVRRARDAGLLPETKQGKAKA